MRGRKILIALGALLGLLVGSALGAAAEVAVAAGFLAWLFTMGRGPTTDRDRLGPRSLAQPEGPVRSPVPGRGADESAKLEYTALFLYEARGAGLLDEMTYLRLKDEIEARRRRLVPAAVPAAHALPPPPARPDAVVVPPSSPVVRPSPPRRRPAPPPSPGWFERMRDLVASDFAVHGLAYLGVLLVFAGTFGFVLFSYGEVGVWVRPIAEVAIPAVLFGSSWFLRGRGAPLVASGLEMLGGALLPVVVAAAFVDGAPVPPDLQHGPLIAALAISGLALAGGYAAWSTRHRDSVLRYLVAPMLWVAVWAVGLALRTAPVVGVGLREVTAPQMALTAVGVAATALLVRVRPGHRIARATEVAVIPGMALVYLLTILRAGLEGWPSAPVAVAGLAALVTSEVVAARLGEGVALSIGQALILGATTAALGSGLGTARGGVVTAVAYLGLLEWNEARRPGDVARAVSAAGVAAGLALSLLQPWTTVAAWGVASAWAHVRRIRVPAGLVAELPTAAAAFLPVGVALGLLEAWPAGRALLVLAAAVVALKAFVRGWLPQDPFYAAWLPAAAASVAAGTAMAWPAAPEEQLAGAAGLAGLALAVGPRWPTVRVWSSASAFAWALWLAFEAADVAAGQRSAAWSVLGAAVVVVASVWRSRSAGHLAAVGYFLGAAGLATSDLGTARVVSLAAWVGAWLTTVVGQELRGAPVVDLLSRSAVPRHRERVRRAASLIPPLFLVASVPFLVVEAADLAGVLEGRRAWSGVALALTSIAYAGAARLLAGRRPLAPVLAIGAFALSAVAIAVAAPEVWPTIEAIAGSILAVGLIGGSLRRPVMTWFAWAMSGVLTLLLAHQAGLATRHLPFALMAWGAALLVGGLALDDLRSGRRRAGEGIRSAWLVRPVCVGALGVPAGLAFVFTGPRSEFGWWSLAAALLYLAVALELRAGAVTGVSYALATVGVAALSPWDPIARPWLFLPWAVLLGAVSLVGPKGARAASPWHRWDLPPLVVAHGVAAVALARATDVGWMPVTWAGFGALSVALAVLRRHWAWAAIGTALVLVGAASAGPGWLALALAATSAGATAAATRSTGAVRVGLQVLAVVAAAGAWGETIDWAGWSADRAVPTTAVAAGALAAVLAVAARWLRLPADWALAWGGLALTGLAVAAGAAPLAERGPAGLGLAAGAALFALGSGLGARPLRVPWLRECSAILVLSSAGTLAYGLRLPVSAMVAGSASLGFAATVTSLAVWRSRPSSPWLQPLALAGLASSAASIAIAAWAWPRRDLLEAALLVAGVESAAAGLSLRRVEPLFLSPMLLCAAWLLFASEALTGEPQWFTAPIGLALLEMCGIARWDRRASGQPLATAELLLLEYLGMALLVGAALLETVTKSPTYGLVGVALGVGIAAWGAFSRVRRRVLVGGGVTVLAVLLMLVGPLARLVPQVHGTALWVTLAAAGVLFIVVATTLEQGRAKVRAIVERLDALMEGWE